MSDRLLLVLLFNLQTVKYHLVCASLLHYLAIKETVLPNSSFLTKNRCSAYIQ